MPNASFVQTNFSGGEISQSAQGRLDLPSYRISLNVCLNSFPLETGAWVRRPGTQHVAPTRGGGRGKLISFAFEQNFPYMMCFTDGYLRFTTGPSLVMTNDQQTVVSISTANPAVVQTASAHGWSTGNAVAFNSLGANDPLLQNRQFTITKIDNTHFSIADGITGASIDGSTLGSFVSGNVTRILEIATTYTAGSWSSLRSVQAEERTLLLNGAQSQVLQVVTDPTPTQFATFSFNPAAFQDGPYFDPITGYTLTPSATSGSVTLTLNSAAGVNGGKGFLASDVGRLIRLFSEPPLWSPTQTYSAPQIVAYTDGNGGYNYWTATTNLAAGSTPGAFAGWALTPTGASWTWAQITGYSGAGLVNQSFPVGNLTSGGGLAAAFDGVTSKNFASSANASQSITTYPAWSSANVYNSGTIVQYNGVAYNNIIKIYPSYSAPQWVSGQFYTTGSLVIYNSFLWQAARSNTSTPPATTSGNPWNQIAAISTSPPPQALNLWSSGSQLGSPIMDVFVGQKCATSSQIQTATLWPSADIGLGNAPSNSYTIYLYGSQSQPTSSSSGTLLASGNFNNTTSPITLVSSDQSTSYAFVWFRIVTQFVQPLPDNGSHVYVGELSAAQAQFFGVTPSNGLVVTAQIMGAALLYGQAIRTFRMGLYSNTTGWPTCGTYHEGRIWLGGVVSNRFDGSVSNGFVGTGLNFAPTAPSGAVNANNAISYICNGEDVNQLLWMKPDQQGILFGTQAGEWLISAPSAGALSPTNVKAVRVTKIGCANIEPRRAEHTLLFVQRFTRKIMEYFADVYSGKFTAPNLTERAKHMTVSGIAEIAYQQELAPIFWARCNNGQLIGATYKRDTLMTSQGPTIIGWHRHQLGSGRSVESIAVGPSQNGNLDTLSMITNDPNTGVRHIELMTDLLDEGFALTQCWFLDDAIVPSSTVVQAAPTGGPYGSLLVNGLSVHNGKTVTAYIAGLDCGDYTVSNGSITVPFGDGLAPGGSGTANGLFTAALVQSFQALPAVVGFTYNSDGQLVRPVSPADTGAREGPGWAKFTRQHRVGAQLFGMVNGSISFGTDFTTMYAAKLLQPNGTPYQINQQWSGIWRDNQNSIYGFDSNMTTWRISRPNPGFVMVVGGFDATADA